MQTVRLAIAIVLLGGCDLVFGLKTVSADAQEIVVERDVSVDAPGTPRSCLDILTAMPGAASAMYTIDPDGPGGNEPVSVACDMTSDGGGWTIIFVAPSTNLMTSPIPYTTTVPTLVQGAADALIAFRDSTLKAIPGAARFALPDDWRTQTPFDFPAQDVPVMASVDGAAAIAGTLRYGTQTFMTHCSDPWIGTTTWGRLCITNTAAPFYAGFDRDAADNCSDSTVAYNTTACSADRQFSIAVR